MLAQCTACMFVFKTKDFQDHVISIFRSSVVPVVMACHVRLRLAQLLLSEEGEESTANHQLGYQTNPEPRFADAGIDTHREVREHVTRTNIVGCKGSCTDRCNRTQDLCRNEGECDVDTSQSLQKNHTETNALNSIECSEPEPQ